MPCLSELDTPALIYNWTHFGEAHCPRPLLLLGPMPSCKSWCKLYGCCLLKGDMCACRVLPCKPSILTHILGILASLPSLYAHCTLLFPDQRAPQAAVQPGFVTVLSRKASIQPQLANVFSHQPCLQPTFGKVLLIQPRLLFIKPRLLANYPGLFAQVPGISGHLGAKRADTGGR